MPAPHQEESHLDPFSVNITGQGGAISCGHLTDPSLNPGTIDYQLCDFIQVMEHLQDSFLVCEMGMENTYLTGVS